MKPRTLAIAAVSFGLALTAATAASAWYARTTGAVHVRQGPGTGYPVIYTLPAGAPVDVGGCQPNWCWINLGGGAGWVSSHYLTSVYPGQPWPYPDYRPYPTYPPYPYYRPFHRFFFPFHNGLDPTN